MIAMNHHIQIYQQYLQLERYGFLLVLILYMTGLLYAWVIPGINLLASFMDIPKLYLHG